MGATPGPPPYKGLIYFTEKDADIYYGRETLSRQIVARLSRLHFLALVGASGSGKTSLLQAGLIPNLRSQGWDIHLITPGAKPLTSLANSISRDETALEFTLKVRQFMLKHPQTLSMLGNKIASRNRSPRLLIAVDQFEEIFTQCHDERERAAFVDNLLTATRQQGAVVVVIGIRADFYEKCAQFPELRHLISRQQEFIGPMKQEELVRVIAEPAKLGKWKLVTGLIEQILEDVGDEPGRLPLLSHALRETWERRRGVMMTLAGYRATGGVEGAIAQTAEDTFKRFDARQATVAKSVFLALTEIGEDAEDTRRTVSRDELEEKLDDPLIDDVLNTLIDARLITADNGKIEVAHEALIRRWPRLRQWLENNRERLRFERQLAQDAIEWEAFGKDPGSLYRGARLQQAIEWVEARKMRPTRLTAQFLSASRQEAEREAREKEAQRQRELEQQRTIAETQQKRAQEAEASAIRLKRRRNIALILASLAIFLAIFLYFMRNEALKQTNLALSNSLITEVQNVNDQELKILLAIEAIRATTDRSQTANPDAIVELQEALSTGLSVAMTTIVDDSFLDTNRGIQFSPDGRYLALQRGPNSGNAKLINSQTSELVSLPSQFSDIDYFFFGPTEQYFAASGGQSVHIFEAATLEAHCPGLAQNGNDTFMTFNEDESLLYAASNSGTGRLWDVQTCKELGAVPPEEPEGYITNAFFIGTEHLYVEITDETDRSMRMLTHWDLSSSGNPEQLNSFDFDRMHVSEDGTRIAYTRNNIVEVIDTITNQPAFNRELELEGRLTVRLGPEGRYLLAAPIRQNRMQLWDVAADDMIRDFTVFPMGTHDRQRGLDFVSHGGRSSLIIWGRQHVELRDPETGDRLPSPPSFVNADIDALAIGPTGEELLIALEDNIILQWDLDENHEIARYLQSIGGFGSMAFRPDGRYIATVPTDGTLRLWANPSTQPKAASAPARVQSENVSGTFSRRNPHPDVLVFFDENQLATWEPLRDERSLIPLTSCQRKTLIDAYTVGASWLVTQHAPPCEDVKSIVWNLATSPPEAHWSLKDVELGELGIPPVVGLNGRFIASSTWMIPFLDEFPEDPEALPPDDFRPDDFPEEDQAVTVWDSVTGESFSLPHRNDFPFYALNPAKPILATVEIAEQVNSVLLWQLDEGDEPVPTVLPVEDEMLGIFVVELAFDSTGEKLFATYGNALRIWDVEAKRVVMERDSISDFTFSADGSLAAVSVLSPTLKAEIWAMDSLEPIASLDLVGLDSPSILEMDASNTLLAMTDATGTVQIWNWSTSETPLRLEHVQRVSDMAFTANGQALLTVTMDGTVRTWILAPENLIEAACSVVSRPLNETEWNAYIGDLKEWRETCAE